MGSCVSAMRTLPLRSCRANHEATGGCMSVCRSGPVVQAEATAGQWSPASTAALVRGTQVHACWLMLLIASQPAPRPQAAPWVLARFSGFALGPPEPHRWRVLRLWLQSTPFAVARAVPVALCVSTPSTAKTCRAMRVTPMGLAHNQSAVSRLSKLVQSCELVPAAGQVQCSCLAPYLLSRDAASCRCTPGHAR